MSSETENKPKFTSTDVVRNEAGRPIAPQPARKFDTMAEQKEEEDKEVGGRKDGTDPTRFGDWEKGGRCVDF
ncbi:hypothetical protein MTBPR1_20047 [Candidatus Terasakiella magnetica]|uniref:DUF1674 domain-containing protein n=1 Tax=Candidatus Terasakiella magnetica TaxID=1867952 RepID=A0A1C3RG18_9PROT|nr:DUF1674 domain-containing protein [Candidatus Terasakiella magnetica]SCA56199.1 hypothetical protein MTBPR1_20047 [Candidatus Terasakiella magnetica]